MKKTVKLLALSVAATGAVALVNHCIFLTAGAPSRGPYARRAYKWRHGTLRYIVAGKGEPVLFIHGMDAGSSLMEWEAQIAALARDYNVYAIDLIGFGESSKPNLSYSAYLFASLINDFISDVIGSPVRAAASGGGAGAVMAACALRPELYHSLLLVSPMGFAEPTRGRRALGALIDLPVIGTAAYNALNSHAAYWCTLLKRRALPMGTVRETYRGAHAGGVGNKYAVAAHYSGMTGAHLDVIAPKLNLPVQICWGARNTANPPTNFHALRNDNIKLTVFAGAGAFPHRSHAGRFNRLCKAFFA